MAKVVKHVPAMQRPYYPLADEHLPHTVRLTERTPPLVPLLSDCGKVNQQWSSHIDGALEGLLDEILWAGNDTQKEFAVNSIHELIAWLYDCNENEDEAMELRQSPSNDCVLEQRINGQWRTAFDYEKCFKKVTPIYSPNETIEALTEMIPVLDDLYEDINENGAQVEFPNTGNGVLDPLNDVKNALLCNVITDYLSRLKKFVDSITNNSASPPTTDDFFTSMTNILGSGFALIVTIFAPPQIKILAYLARAGAGATFAYSAVSNTPTVVGYIQQTRENAFNTGGTTAPPDAEAIKEMACAMFDSMKNKPITLANFNAGVDAIYAPTGVFQAVIDMYRIIMKNNAVFAEFIAIYSQAIIAQQTGANFNEDDCDCVEPPLDCGINYQFLGVEVIPTDITMYQRIPFTGAVVVTPIVVLQWQRPSPPPVNNQFRELYINYDVACDKPITLMWARGNANSAVAQIQTYDGTNWVVRAGAVLNVGGAGGVPQTLNWANPTAIAYVASRVMVRTSVPFIIQYRVQ